MVVEEEAKAEEAKAEEEPAKEEQKDEEMKAEEEEEEEATEPEKAELTDEEKKLRFRPKTDGFSDLTPGVLNTFFGKFSIPDKSEGFADVRFEWQNEAKSKAYLKKWVLERKRTSRMEELTPSQWFKEKSSEWQKLFQEWQTKQKAFKATPAGKKMDEHKTDEEKAEDKSGDVNVSSVEDVCDVGGGVPLFARFNMEDWALLQLRFELYLLQRAFKHDVDDEDRVGIIDEHLAFYYSKYWRKSLSPKNFGVETNAALLDFIKDTVTVTHDDNKVLASPLSDDVDELGSFLKLTEEKRRERQRRIDAGDETAKLKFSPLAVTQPMQQLPRATDAGVAGAQKGTFAGAAKGNLGKGFGGTKGGWQGGKGWQQPVWGKGK